MSFSMRPGSNVQTRCNHRNCKLATSKPKTVHQRQQHSQLMQTRECTYPAQRMAGPAAAAQQSAITPQSSVGEKYFAQDQRPIILFDGVCNLCNGGVNTLLQWDSSGVYRLAALQSAAGKALLKRSGRSPDDISSIVLVEEDQSYIKSEAILRIGRRLNVPFQILGTMGLVVVPGFLRDAAYDAVANNRYNLFGKTSYCRLTDGEFSNRFIDA